jgi:hypothetical protein
VARPKASPAGKGDFAAALREALGAAPGSAPVAPTATPPVDLATTLERMQRVTAHLKQARTYFQPLPTTAPRLDAEA